MPVPRHVYDRAAERIADYIDSMSDKLVATMTDGGSNAPFSAPLTRAEQEAYYVAKYGEYIFTPDGLPNEQGREALLEAFGAEAFATIVRLVIRDRHREAVVAEEPPLAFPLTHDQAGLPEPPPPDQEVPGADEAAY